MATLHDIENELASALTYSSGLRNNLNIGFFHFLSGPPRKPYSLRRSKVFAHESSWLDVQRKTLQASNLTHDDALKDYIRYMDREATLLHLGVQLLEKETTQPDILVGKLLVEDNSGTSPQIDFPARLTLDGGVWTITWRLNRIAADFVAPTRCVRQLFRWLYRNGPEEHNWKTHFEIARAHLFGHVAPLTSRKSRSRNMTLGSKRDFAYGMLSRQFSQPFFTSRQRH